MLGLVFGLLGIIIKIQLFIIKLSVKTISTGVELTANTAYNLMPESDLKRGIGISTSLTRVAGSTSVSLVKGTVSNSAKLVRTTGKAVKNTAKLVKNTIKLGNTIAKMSYKAIITMMRILDMLLKVAIAIISFILGNIVLTVIVLIVVIIASSFLLLFWDKVGIKKGEANVEKIVATSNATSTDSTTTNTANLVGDINNYTRESLINKWSSDNIWLNGQHTRTQITVKAKRSDLTKFANTLMSKTVTNGWGKEASAYFAYEYGGGHPVPYLAGSAYSEQYFKVDTKFQDIEGIYGVSPDVVALDCSGFVPYFYGTLFCYTEQGKSKSELYTILGLVPCDGSTAANLTTDMPGKVVTREEILAGDIIYTNSHVGVCIDNKNFINALDGKSGVKISDIDTYIEKHDDKTFTFFRPDIIWTEE